MCRASDFRGASVLKVQAWGAGQRILRRRPGKKLESVIGKIVLRSHCLSLRALISGKDMEESGHVVPALSMEILSQSALSPLFPDQADSFRALEPPGG